jgi:hypothetical protein
MSVRRDTWLGPIRPGRLLTPRRLSCLDGYEGARFDSHLSSQYPPVMRLRGAYWQAVGQGGSCVRLSAVRRLYRFAMQSFTDFCSARAYVLLSSRPS